MKQEQSEKSKGRNNPCRINVKSPFWAQPVPLDNGIFNSYKDTHGLKLRYLPLQSVQQAKNTKTPATG